MAYDLGPGKRSQVWSIPKSPTHEIEASLRYLLNDDAYAHLGGLSAPNSNSNSSERPTRSTYTPPSPPTGSLFPIDRTAFGPVHGSVPYERQPSRRLLYQDRPQSPTLSIQSIANSLRNTGLDDHSRDTSPDLARRRLPEYSQGPGSDRSSGQYDRNGYERPVRRALVPEGPSASNKKPSLYKSELCRSFKDRGHCEYGVRCQFAHGTEDLRKPSIQAEIQASDYCESFWKTGYCSFGSQCPLIHGAPASSAPSRTAYSEISFERDLQGHPPLSSKVIPDTARSATTLERPSYAPARERVGAESRQTPPSAILAFANSLREAPIAQDRSAHAWGLERDDVSLAYAIDRQRPVSLTTSSITAMTPGKHRRPQPLSLGSASSIWSQRAGTGAGTGEDDDDGSSGVSWGRSTTSAPLSQASRPFLWSPVKEKKRHRARERHHGAIGSLGG